jgi:hypothetical protein
MRFNSTLDKLIGSDGSPPKAFKVRGAPVTIVAMTVVYLLAAALLLSASGCASNRARLDSAESRYGIHLSMPFDNARDEGPTYLVGPLAHRGGRGTKSSSVDEEIIPSRAQLLADPTASVPSVSSIDPTTR